MVHLRNSVTASALAAGLLLLTACGSDGGSSAEGSGEAVRVGVLFAGSVSDQGFMQSAHLGYLRAGKAHQGKARLTMVEQIPAADYEAALVRFAGSSDLVISLGGQTDASVRKVAPRFPEVKFVEIGGPADGKPLANLGLYDPQQAEAAFLSGASAALLSKKGTVGFVGGAELPAIVNAAEEFANGAKAAKPGVRVLPPQYPGDFNDVAKAKQSALADFGAGADVLGQVLNLGQKGLAQAASQRGGRIVGGPIPAECGSAPAYAGYVKTDIGAEIEYAVAHALDGTWKAENVKFGLTADKPASDLLVCGADAATRRKLDELKQRIATGKITTL
ncbi:BMP family protein [Streptomyces sp. NBC_01257]|uniref:BMP family protein n=1 Tax=Streptomyces sp. NBC_01257 TaxID=2903799 RepID=UPI002DD80C88|nr:BMP family protein [Streptomyces sp. NBC_01257]WRZ65244.1 BMP family protein [Streptomyces sp. NBC_01257]